MLAKNIFGRCTILLLLFVLIAFHNPAKAQFKSIDTDELTLIYYDFGHEMLLGHTIRSFSNSLEFHKEKFDYDPTQKISVIVQDFGDYGNAGASAVPHNVILMGIAPLATLLKKSRQTSGSMY